VVRTIYFNRESGVRDNYVHSVATFDYALPFPAVAPDASVL
jgi:hypothetical protein